MIPAPDRRGRRASAWLAAGACLALLLAACLADSGSGSAPSGVSGLRITEIHYNPTPEDTNSGDEFEFIEIKNASSAALSIGGYAFTDGIQYTFPGGTSVPAGGFIVLASNAALFQERYGFAPFGTYQGHLLNSGETVTLSTSATGTTVASVSYGGGAWPSKADGGGYSLVLRGTATDYSAPSWRASFSLQGSPGKDDAGVVLINEVLTHTDLPDVDAIELFNYGDDTARIGGWYLSDDKTYPKKFRIPAGTVIPPMGYKVFDETDFNAHPGVLGNFRLSAHGDEVWLFADSIGCAAGYCHGAKTSEIENGVTFGRFVNGAGQEHFVAQSARTLGAANAGPRAGSVVISEIMYHPANDTDEYLELANITAHPVALFDTTRPLNTWKIQGFSFTFPVATTLAAGEVILVIPGTVTAQRIRSAYGINSSIRIFQAAGKMSNSGETLSLLRPFDPFVADGSAPGDSTLPYIVIDQVTYSDQKPWSSLADGGGSSLKRKTAADYGDDPDNWKDALPTPGY